MLTVLGTSGSSTWVFMSSVHAERLCNLTSTWANRRSSAESVFGQFIVSVGARRDIPFSIYSRYSAKVVAPITLSLPRALRQSEPSPTPFAGPQTTHSSGLMRFPASMPPDESLPAMRRCISSTKSMMGLPSSPDFSTSVRTALTPEN